MDNTAVKKEKQASDLTSKERPGWKYTLEEMKIVYPQYAHPLCYIIEPKKPEPAPSKKARRRKRVKLESQSDVPVADLVPRWKRKKEQQVVEQSDNSTFPNDLVCWHCKGLVNNAVLTPCCVKCYCYECIRFFLNTSGRDCPGCIKKNLSPELDLIPAEHLRKRANDIRITIGDSIPEEVAERPPQSPPRPKAKFVKSKRFTLDELPKVFLPHSPKKSSDSDPPTKMAKESPASPSTTHVQLAPEITTKPDPPETPIESPPPRLEVSPPGEIGSVLPSSPFLNREAQISGYIGCGNIQRDGGPPPPQQQLHWGQEPHMPPNVSPLYCATELLVGAPLGHDSFYGLPPPAPGYMPSYHNSYSWQSYPEMCGGTQSVYYYEGPQPPMDYGYESSGPATYAQNPNYRMDEPFGKGQDEPKRQRIIEDPLEEFERIMAEKDARKMAQQITGRRRPRSRSISPAPTRTSRYSPERSRSRRRSFSRSPSPKRRRSHGRNERRDGKSSRSPSKNSSSSPRQNKRNFGVAGHDDKRKEKRTHYSSSDRHHKKERKDTKEKRKEESKRRSRH